LKKRNGREYKIHDIAATFSFLAFAGSWFYCRLYLFPLKVIYMGLYGSVNMCDHRIPFVPFFNGMLILLLIMNIWWFHFIILLIYRVATGQQHEVEDTREYEPPDGENKLAPHSDAVSPTNGVMKNGHHNTNNVRKRHQ